LSRLLFALGLAATFGALPALADAGGSPRAYCARVVNDAVTKPIPPALVGATRRVLNVRLSDADVQRTGVYRCMSGRVLVCVVGANLNCGKADLDIRSPAADQYCRANPGATFIPMFVTGHETAWAWSCSGPHAVAGAPLQPIDAQGFTSGVWATVP
jgi:hypothetical protein